MNPYHKTQGVLIMKAKNILLSAIILGGLSLVTTQTVSAQSIETKVIQQHNANEKTHTNNQTFREKKLTLDQPVDLTNLDTNTTIEIPATTKNFKNEIDNIAVNLTNEEIKNLQGNKKTAFQTKNLTINLNWGGTLTYKCINTSLVINFDENTQKLYLAEENANKKLDHLTYELVNGDANVHYVYKDTGKEIYQAKHEDAYNLNDNNYEEEEARDFFTVSELSSLQDAPAPKGHFDAIFIDFDNLDGDKAPLNPLNATLEGEPINIKFNRADLTPDTTEYTVELEPAKPMTINFIVYLDDKVYDKKIIKGDINDTIPLQDNEKLPSKEIAKLNNYKTSYSVSFEYLPQLGIQSMTGKAFHQTIFDRLLDEPRSSDFLNKTIFFASEDSTSEESTMLDINSAGKIVTMEIHYESINNGQDTNNDSTANKPDEGTNKPDPDNDNHGNTDENKPDESANKPDSDNNTPGNTNENKPNEGSNNHGSGSTKPPVTNLIPQPSQFDGFIGTMKSDVNLYKITDGKLSLVKNRALSKYSDWKTDSIITINGIKYYRVATNEWVKSTDIYRYEIEQGNVDTHNKEITYLVSSNNEQIKNRGLAANTSWHYDRITYLGAQDEKHYRVATNEFVHDQDIVKKK